MCLGPFLRLIYFISLWRPYSDPDEAQVRAKAWSSLEYNITIRVRVFFLQALLKYCLPKRCEAPRSTQILWAFRATLLSAHFRATLLITQNGPYYPYSSRFYKMYPFQDPGRHLGRFWARKPNS